MSMELIISNEHFEKCTQSIYVQDEYALEYEINKTSNGSILLMYDTLTIVFDRISKKFLSLDAYTNKQNWLITPEFIYPKIIDEGVLKISDECTELDRCSFKFRPRYEFATNRILIIKVCEDDSKSEFYRIADNLLVGMKNNLPTSFIIEGVEIK